MKFKGKILILDNFRQVLKEYTVDVQDVVRSAILDNIDISQYIDSCNPYKLDQIRLALKEGLNPTFFSVSGEMLYQIRKLTKEGFDLREIEKPLKANLSPEHTEYVIQWVLDGVKFSNINIALIPKKYLSVYDKGLRAGVNMEKFYKIQKSLVSPQYIECCIVLETMGRNTEILCKNVWNIEVLELLKKYSDLSLREWKLVETYIKYSDSVERVNYLLQMIMNNIDISDLQKQNYGEYIYDSDCLAIILEGYRENIDIKKLMSTTDSNEMSTLLTELKLKKVQKVSGRLMKKQN